MGSSLSISEKQKFLDAALVAVQKSREVLLHYFGQLTQVQEKGALGLVSEADRESERVIQEILKTKTPEIGFLGEEESYESGVKPKAFSPDRSLWVVDPLDGTTNYVHRFPIFCTSIGLWHKGALQVGVVDVPMLNTTYSAMVGEGSFRDGKPIRVSGCDRLESSFLATGFNALDSETLQRQLAIFSRVVAKARGLRRAGSAAYDLCLVAEGVFDGFWEYNLKPWDTAAGALLVRESGGRVSNAKGEEFHLDDEFLIASTPGLHKVLLQEKAEALSSGLSPVKKSP